MGIRTNIVSKNGNPPISYNILQGESNKFPKNIILDANYVDDIEANLQEQIDNIKSKSDVVDIVADKSELDQYDTSELSNNNIIKVLSDETQGGHTTYYKWNEAENQFEYVGQEGSYYTITEIDGMMANIEQHFDEFIDVDVEEEEIQFNP